MPIRDIIIEDIDDGHYDEELGQMVRDPKYSEHTAMEIKAVLTDRIVEGLGLKRSGIWFDRIVWTVCIVGLVVLITLIRWRG